MTTQDITKLRGLLMKKIVSTTRTVQFAEVELTVVGFKALLNGQRVKVQFLDDGPGPATRHHRYNCQVWVVDEHGHPLSECATGNGADSWETALSIVQWHRLDEPA